MSKKICILVIGILLLILIFISLFIINKGLKNDNADTEKEISNNEEEVDYEDFNLIYTNNTNSTELSKVQMGLYNYSNNQYYDVLEVNIPDKYLISNLEYISGTEQIYGIENYKYSDYTFNPMQDTVDMISNIATDHMITHIAVSDYISNKIDKATVLDLKLYSPDVGLSEYEKNVITIKNKKVYYSFYDDGILGPTVAGKIIIDGEEQIEYRHDKMVLNTEGCLELDYELSNPNIVETNCEEYLKILMDMITLE